MLRAVVHGMYLICGQHKKLTVEHLREITP